MLQSISPTADRGGRVERMAFSMKEAAEAVGVCERSIWQAIKDGRLKSVRIGRSVRITREALAEFLAD